MGLGHGIHDEYRAEVQRLTGMQLLQAYILDRLRI